MRRKRETFRCEEFIIHREFTLRSLRIKDIRNDSIGFLTRDDRYSRPERVSRDLE